MLDNLGNVIVICMTHLIKRPSKATCHSRFLCENGLGSKAPGIVISDYGGPCDVVQEL